MEWWRLQGVEKLMNVAYNGLTTITIPDSVTVIGANPFRWCGGLKEIVASADHPVLEMIDGRCLIRRSIGSSATSLP